MLSRQRQLSSKNNTSNLNTKRVLTHLALEGITPSSALQNDMQLLEEGKLTKDEFIKRAVARAKE